MLDVTHALRSLPILMLLAAAYLRAVKSVTIEHIVYGAYDPKDPANNRTPVFDLTPFLQLFDWLTAADIFIKTGDARDLAGLLKEAHNQPWKTAPDRAEGLPKTLKSIPLEGLSYALAVTRPGEIVQQATALAANLERAASEAAAWAKPFVSLLEHVRRTYEPLASSSLAGQQRLVRWYVEHGRVIQAVLLAREWLVSLACHHLQCDSIERRAAVKAAINQQARMKRDGERTITQREEASLDAFAISDRLVDAWNRVHDLRDDLAHCGMRQQPRPPRSVLQEAAKLPDLLETMLSEGGGAA